MSRKQDWFNCTMYVIAVMLASQLEISVGAQMLIVLFFGVYIIQDNK